MAKERIAWSSLTKLAPREFVCGHCGRSVASDLGYSSGANFHRIWICPNCTKPTYFYYNDPIPGVAPGNSVASVPNDLHKLYDEARQSVSVNAHTSAVLACRKLLMNIAVTQGAKEGLKFIQYVEYLSDSGFVPPNGKGWVDHIRTKGNEATHEIALMTKDDAIELISFAEMLLKFIYEFPAKVPAPPTAVE